MTDVFAALADPTRRRILHLVRDRERSVNEIVDACDITQSGISKQLRVLHDAGLVTVRQDGRRRMYALRGQPLQDLDAWLEDFRAGWSGHLDALERALADKKRRKKRGR